jgi:hypothetical protein
MKSRFIYRLLFIKSRYTLVNQRQSRCFTHHLRRRFITPALFFLKSRLGLTIILTSI